MVLDLPVPLKLGVDCAVQRLADLAMASGDSPRHYLLEFVIGLKAQVVGHPGSDMRATGNGNCM